MNPQELRLGNCVFNRVTEMYEEIVRGKDIEFAKEVFDPIELDEKQLKKFGVENDIEPYELWEFEMHDFEDGNFGVYWKGHLLVIIKYVHQLQNLYFVLKGEELKMKS